MLSEDPQQQVNNLPGWKYVVSLIFSEPMLCFFSARQRQQLSGTPSEQRSANTYFTSTALKCWLGVIAQSWPLIPLGGSLQQPPETTTG